METRKRIGVYIDFSLRLPSFVNTFSNFKNSLFTGQHHNFTGDIETTGEVNFYWKKQLEDKNIEDFYMRKNIEGITDYQLRKTDFKEFFFNEEHWIKFIEEYSYNLYADAEALNKKDIDLLNITQLHLFEVVLIDRFFTTRKKGNTFYFLSKNRIYPQAVLFLGPGQEINNSGYFGIWDPSKNDEQENGEGLGLFENWLKDLEVEWKKEKFANG